MANSHSAEKVTEKLAKILFYNTLIRVLIEGYMSLSLACFIGLATINEDHEGPGWKRFNIFLSVSLLIIILTVPVLLFRIISKNYRQIGDETFLIKYNTLYDCLNYDKNKTSLYYIPLLFSKRVTIAFSIVLLR